MWLSNKLQRFDKPLVQFKQVRFITGYQHLQMYEILINVSSLLNCFLSQMIIFFLNVYRQHYSGQLPFDCSKYFYASELKWLILD